MPDSLIIGYGVVLDDAGRVLLLRRRAHEELWPGSWWLPGDVTPLTEEPDDTVPRLFRHLLRQQIRAAYAHTVYGPDPSSGRHTIHNAYLVTVESALDGAPQDERNPFEAMEWWEIDTALAELPDQQAELLGTVVERLQEGWRFEDDTSLDALFDETGSPDAAIGSESPAALSPRHLTLVRLASRIAASHAIGRDADLDADLQEARSQGWSVVELEQIAALASELGRAASLDCAPASERTERTSRTT